MESVRIEFTRGDGETDWIDVDPSGDCIRSEVSGATEIDYPEQGYSSDNRNDIQEAIHHNFVFQAADLLGSATECPAISAVIGWHCANGNSALVEEQSAKDRADWFRWWAENARNCPHCNSWQFVDYWSGVDTHCYNCGEWFTVADSLRAEYESHPLDPEELLAGFVSARLWADSLHYDPATEELESVSVASEDATYLGGIVAQVLFDGPSTWDDADSEGLDPDFIKEVSTDFLGFLGTREAKVLLRRFHGRTDRTSEQIGHDIALSASRHGTGCWDRTSEQIGSRLHDAVTTYFGHVSHIEVQEVDETDRFSIG